MKNRITDISQNVKYQLISRIQNNQFYSLQLDERKDISNNSNLLAFIRYEHDDNIREDCLFCHSLPTHPTGEEIFKCIDNFINDLEWAKCIGVHR